MSAAKPTSEETVAKALASGNEMTSAEIAAVVGLGRSTVGKALAVLERTGVVRRHVGGQDGRRRLAERWSVGHSDEPSPPSDRRLRPGQLDRLVLDDERAPRARGAALSLGLGEASVRRSRG
jgi:DNA-binding transcriptional ArsR family regulator